MSGSFGLACPHCAHIFPREITVGVMGAHYDAEHGVDDPTGITLDLVVLCPRCQQKMAHERQIRPGRDRYRCDPCHRTRIVNHNGGITPTTDERSS